MKGIKHVTEEELRRIYEIALRQARERITARILVEEAMTTTVISIRRGADIHEAARILSEYRISGMPGPPGVFARQRFQTAVLTAAS